MDRVSVFCFLASYAVATGFEFLRLRTSKAWLQTLTIGMSIAGLVAHTVYLLSRSFQADLPPLMASSHDWLLVLAWLAVLFYLFLTLLDTTVPLATFVLPIVLALVVTSRFVSLEPLSFVKGEASQAAARGWLMLHVSMLAFGIVGVLASLILAAMYLVQHRRLKHRHGSPEGMHLPSLARLARWNWWAVVVSVPLLTFGMAAGVLLGLSTKTVSTPVVFSDPVVIGSCVGWLVMVGFFGWLVGTSRPVAKQVALLTIWACSFLVVTIVGLQVITSSSGLGSLHS